MGRRRWSADFNRGNCQPRARHAGAAEPDRTAGRGVTWVTMTRQALVLLLSLWPIRWAFPPETWAARYAPRGPFFGWMSPVRATGTQAARSYNGASSLGPAVSRTFDGVPLFVWVGIHGLGVLDRYG
jgi:hypothetical protein